MNDEQTNEINNKSKLCTQLGIDKPPQSDNVTSGKQIGFMRLF